MADTTVKRDVCGMIYDYATTDAHGVTHYTRYHALGTAEGPAQWSSEHDCNPSCGCHLAAKCLGCNVCLTCDGCYCRENNEPTDHQPDPDGVDACEP